LTKGGAIVGGWVREYDEKIETKPIKSEKPIP
jgi:hypothetical protein